MMTIYTILLVVFSYFHSFGEPNFDKYPFLGPY